MIALTWNLLTHEIVLGIATDVVPFETSIVSHFNAIFILHVVWFAFVPIFEGNWMMEEVQPVTFSLFIAAVDPVRFDTSSLSSQEYGSLNRII